MTRWKAGGIGKWCWGGGRSQGALLKALLRCAKRLRLFRMWGKSLKSLKSGNYLGRFGVLFRRRSWKRPRDLVNNWDFSEGCVHWLQMRAFPIWFGVFLENTLGSSTRFLIFIALISLEYINVIWKETSMFISLVKVDVFVISPCHLSDISFSSILCLLYLSISSEKLNLNCLFSTYLIHGLLLFSFKETKRKRKAIQL